MINMTRLSNRDKDLILTHLRHQSNDLRDILDDLEIVDPYESSYIKESLRRIEKSIRIIRKTI
ncbi:MAG: hypothetical protein GF384_08020 [Elusimicrobia bacterium]|nr:hypothetical protein [Elusimicrobiota bacterium]